MLAFYLSTYISVFWECYTGFDLFDYTVFIFGLNGFYNDDSEIRGQQPMLITRSLASLLLSYFLGFAVRGTYMSEYMSSSYNLSLLGILKCQQSCDAEPISLYKL